MEDAVFDAFYRLTNSSNQITSYVFDVVRLFWQHVWQGRLESALHPSF